MKPLNICEFDEPSHTYRIDGRVVPSVTQVLRDIIPGWSAGEWYLQRGRAVHACAEMIARGQAFENDPAIDGQVAALRRFFREVKPDVLAVECRVHSADLQYGGTYDMLCGVGNKTVLVDYKASLDERVAWQLAGYSQAMLPTADVRYGLGVEITGDGTYRMSAVYDLRRYRQEWLALLTAYRVRRKCGINEEVAE